MSEDKHQQLHPNLARLTVRYDDIYANMVSGVLTQEQAREQMLQLCERDDHGVSWKIDPDTGDFLRLTAFGDLEYDTPPTSGILTADPFTYNTESRDDDPMTRLRMFSDDSMAQPTHAPAVAEPKKSRGSLSHTGHGVTHTSTKMVAVVVAGALFVALGLALLFTSVRSETPLPGPPGVSEPASPASAGATPKKKKKKNRGTSTSAVLPFRAVELLVRS
jgi:hypothetical protein